MQNIPVGVISLDKQKQFPYTPIHRKQYRIKIKKMLGKALVGRVRDET